MGLIEVAGPKTRRRRDFAVGLIGLDDAGTDRYTAVRARERKRGVGGTGGRVVLLNLCNGDGLACGFTHGWEWASELGLFVHMNRLRISGCLALVA